MNILKNKTSITRYRASGALPSEGMFEAVRQAVRSRPIQDIDGDPGDMAYGWTSVNKPLNPDFVDPTMIIGEFITLAMRIDKKNVPKKVVDKRFEAEQARRLRESGRAHLSKAEKKDIKDRIIQELLIITPATPNVYSVVWNYSTSRLSLYTSQKAAAETFETLFSKTFGLNLIRVFPYTEVVSTFPHNVIPLFENLTSSWGGAHA